MGVRLGHCACWIHRSHVVTDLQVALFVYIGFGLGLAATCRSERPGAVQAPPQASAVCICPAAPVPASNEEIDDVPPFPQKSREEILATKRAGPAGPQ